MEDITPLFLKGLFISPLITQKLFSYTSPHSSHIIISNKITSYLGLLWWMEGGRRRMRRLPPRPPPTAPPTPTTAA
jgi:hypothetical protein